jgi:hypothetical protein
MKKVFAIFSSLLVFAGVKAQTPTVKKETLKPAAVKPGIVTDPSITIKNGATIKQTDKAIKFDKTSKITDKVLKVDHIKKTNADIPFKDAIAKPDKH